MEDANKDIIRINQLKDYRKLFTDTMVTTTHFLKKCVKVPKIEVAPMTPGSNFSRSNLTYAALEKQRQSLDHQHKNAFQRGAMNFEDYNYDQFNRFILVDVNKPKMSVQGYPSLTSKKTSQMDYGNDLDNLGTLGQMPDDLGLEDPDEMVGFSLPDGAKKG